VDINIISFHFLSIKDHRKFVDPHTSEVDGKLYSARQILVSDDGGMFTPSIHGKELNYDKLLKSKLTFLTIQNYLVHFHISCLPCNKILSVALVHLEAKTNMIR